MIANYAEQFRESPALSARPGLSGLSQAVAVDWRLASCRDGGGGLLGLFFSEEIGDIAAAKRICAACPVQEPCLDGALQRREPWGVWGGQLFLNGRILPFKRKRGRPPKNPPAELIA